MSHIRNISLDAKNTVGDGLPGFPIRYKMKKELNNINSGISINIEKNETKLFNSIIKDNSLINEKRDKVRRNNAKLHPINMELNDYAQYPSNDELY